jgi:putative PIN family toxin of toxin-antitoxin system
VRAIVDTNLLIAAVLWHGLPHRLLEHARAGALTLVSSTTLIAELEEVLARGKFSSILNRVSLSHEQAFEQLQQLTVVVDAPPLLVPVCRDPDDDHVLAAARAAGADSIITGDQDLLTLGSFQDIPIRTARQALAILDPLASSI